MQYSWLTKRMLEREWDIDLSKPNLTPPEKKQEPPVKKAKKIKN